MKINISNLLKQITQKPKQEKTAGSGQSKNTDTAYDPKAVSAYLKSIGFDAQLKQNTLDSYKNLIQYPHRHDDHNY